MLPLIIIFAIYYLARLRSMKQVFMLKKRMIVFSYAPRMYFAATCAVVSLQLYSRLLFPLLLIWMFPLMIFFFVSIFKICKIWVTGNATAVVIGGSHVWLHCNSVSLQPVIVAPERSPVFSENMLLGLNWLLVVLCCWFPLRFHLHLRPSCGCIL